MSSLLSASSAMGTMDDTKPSMCLSPQDKLKGSSSSKSSLAAAVQRKKTAISSAGQASMSMAVAVSALAAMDFEMVDAADMDDVDLDLELVDDDSSSSDHDMDMDGAAWVNDDNLRSLEFDDRLNQDIDWVTHDDVETSLKIEFIPSSGDDVQDFAYDPSSFLSPLRVGLSFDDSDMSASFAESLSVDTPPPSFGTTSLDAEKLLMSFDTMNFTIPSPTSSSTRKRASLFGKKETSDENAADKSSSATSSASTASRSSISSTGSMSPSLKLKAGATSTDEARKDDARVSLSKLSIPTPEFLGVLNITTTTPTTKTSSHHHQGVDTQRKIGSYSPDARRLRIQKFHEKRKNRTWKKSIKYDCRKKLADDRPRIKGRFVRVHENASDVKEEDSCSATSSSSGGSPAPSSASSSPCGGSPIKVEPVAMPVVTPVTVPAMAVALLAAQLQPAPRVVVPAAPAAAPVPASVPARASMSSSS